MTMSDLINLVMGVGIVVAAAVLRSGMAILAQAVRDAGGRIQDGRLAQAGYEDDGDDPEPDDAPVAEEARVLVLCGRKAA